MSEEREEKTCKSKPKSKRYNIACEFELEKKRKLTEHSANEIDLIGARK